MQEKKQDTICHRILKFKERTNSIAVEYKKNKKWKALSWLNYYDYVEHFFLGLNDLGFKKDDKIIIASNTRLEWAISDLAILSIGAVTVPIYPNTIPEEMSFIIKNSEAKGIIFENEALYRKFQSIQGEVPQDLIKIGIDFSNEDVLSWEKIWQKGKSLLPEEKDLFRKICEQRSIDELATVVYTSGTTGLPKGVELRHEQIASEVIEVLQTIDVTEKDKTLTFLPFSHILGRMEHWAHVYKGFTMGYAESIERIKSNLPELQPTFMIAVPRIFEKIYDSIRIQIEASPLKRKIFDWALSVGFEVSEAKSNKKLIPVKTILEYQLAKKLVFQKLTQKLGGALRFAFSGGAPLSAEISKFFHAMGILILEGYGLTETTAAIVANTPYDFKFGTVGKSFGEVELKIASDGEICVRSKKVMRSYYKNDEATKAVFDEDGYFKTGDIGEIDSDGFLKITDRKKDLIKTAGGKFVAPQKLENLLKESPYIANVLIHGDKRKYVVCLITLNQEMVVKYAKDQGISFQSTKDLYKDIKIKDLIRDSVAQANSRLASFESIKNFAILPRDFSIEAGELTPSLKVKRKVCDQIYAQEIDSLYGDAH